MESAFEIREGCEDLEYCTAKLMAYHCMPTLMKVKPSNLFSVNSNKLQDSDMLIRGIELRAAAFDCSFFILYENEGILLCFVYNEKLLRETISIPLIHIYLRACGYSLLENITATIQELSKRYRSYKEGNSEFPHEVGLLLGYPYRDVMDFIRFGGSNYITCGYWKVYHEKEKAILIFEDYRRLRKAALQLVATGAPLSDMNQIEMVDHFL